MHPFSWKKLGKIFDPALHQTAPWMSEYAQLPFPVSVSDEVLRIYFATRPKKGLDNLYVSRSGYVEVLKADLAHIVNISEKPIIELGGPGTFDEFGSMTSSFVQLGNKMYAYYTGWTRMQSVPYTMAIGMAISTDGGLSFKKKNDGPILGITYNEPYLLSGPIVKIIDGRWHMWYLNGTKWIHHKNKFEPVYKLAHATSEDGINWSRDGKEIMPSMFADECQVSFALFRYRDVWNVIFAYRKATDFREETDHAYRLGFAWSDDLKQWHRNDSIVGLDVSTTGWDSQMIAYPQVCEIGDRLLIFYCGNNFGYEGFGVAELIKP